MFLISSGFDVLSLINLFLINSFTVSTRTRKKTHSLHHLIRYLCFSSFYIYIYLNFWLELCNMYSLFVWKCISLVYLSMFPCMFRFVISLFLLLLVERQLDILSNRHTCPDFFCLKEHLTWKKFSFGHCPNREGWGACPNFLALFPPWNCPLYLTSISCSVYILVIFNTKIIKITTIIIIIITPIFVVIIVSWFCNTC